MKEYKVSAEVMSQDQLNGGFRFFLRSTKPIFGIPVRKQHLVALCDDLLGSHENITADTDEEAQAKLKAATLSAWKEVMPTDF